MSNILLFFYKYANVFFNDIFICEKGFEMHPTCLPQRDQKRLMEYRLKVREGRRGRALGRPH